MIFSCFSPWNAPHPTPTIGKPAAKIKMLSVAGNSSLTMNIEAHTRLLVLTCAAGSFNSRTSMELVSTNSQGTVAFVELRNGSDITYSSPSAGKFVITNSNSSNVQIPIIVFAGNVSY